MTNPIPIDVERLKELLAKAAEAARVRIEVRDRFNTAFSEQADAAVREARLARDDAFNAFGHAALAELPTILAEREAMRAALSRSPTLRNSNNCRSRLKSTISRGSTND